MDMGRVPLAAVTTRLGLLQRGRGAGWLAAGAAGSAAADELLHCVRNDPRYDLFIEERERYYGELLVGLAVPLGPLLRELADQPELQLAHGVLAAAWCLGHQDVRAFLADHGDGPLLSHLVAELYDRRWARAVDLPQAAAREWLRLAASEGDSAEAVPGRNRPTRYGQLSVQELLDLVRPPSREYGSRVIGELCARGDEATRQILAKVVADDVLYERVRVAAQALGTMGDERVLDLAESLFAREDVFHDPRRRLHGFERMRRLCLSDYVVCLPPARARVLARRYMELGGFFETVAGRIFAEHATAADRALLEARIAEKRRTGDDLDTILELEGLARLGDPRSAPLLVELATTTDYSLARMRAIAALSAMPEAPGAAGLLHEALWDCESEAAAIACGFAPLDAPASERLRQLAGSPLVEPELAGRAARRAAAAAQPRT